MNVEDIRYFKLAAIGFVFAYIYLFLNQYKFFRKNLIGQIFPFATGIAGAIIIVYSNILFVNQIGKSSAAILPYFGWLLIIFGGVVFVLSWELNFKSKRHGDEDKFLYTKGMYALCRNPQTFGLFLILAGEVLYTIKLNSLYFSILNTALFLIYAILEEKLDMEKKFGEKFTKYKENTPIIIPTPPSIKRCVETFWGRG
ncbi:methyltransferase family protein [candidate division KSB1 bacterium]